MRISDWSSDVCSSDLWYGVLVCRKAAALKGLDSNVTSNIEWSKIRQKQMTVRSSGYQSQPASRKCIAKHPGIIYDLLAVAKEIRLERSEEHTSELPSLMSISYAVLCLK